MYQPPGFVDPRVPYHVCRLCKALYGLKQEPHAWYQRFANFLIDTGFIITKSDSSLFVFHRGSEIAYVLLYVDDIILVIRQCPSASFNISFANCLSYD